MTTDPLDGLEQLRRIIDEQPEPAPESVMLGLDYCYAEWVAERARHAEEVAALRAQLREVTAERVEGERDEAQLEFERTRRALNAVLAVLEKGPRYTDRHMEAAADSVVEEIREAIALASGEAKGVLP